MKKIELRKPVMINGKEVKELTYDIEKINGEMFSEADAMSSSAAAAKGKITMDLAEFDTSFQFYLGAFAVLAVNPEYDISDIERIEGPDLMEIYKIGRNFTGGADAPEEETEKEDLLPEILEKDTEDMPESTTQVPEN